jgi:hypothetical protein
MNNFLLVEKENPFNEMKSSCADSLPRFQEENKLVVGLGQFPITLMSVHS